MSDPITRDSLLKRGWEVDPFGEHPDAVGKHTGSDCYLVVHFCREKVDHVNLETRRDAVHVSKRFRTMGDLDALLAALKVEDEPCAS